MLVALGLCLCLSVSWLCLSVCFCVASLLFEYLCLSDPSVEISIYDYEGMYAFVYSNSDETTLQEYYVSPNEVSTDFRNFEQDF